MDEKKLSEIQARCEAVFTTLVGEGETGEETGSFVFMGDEGADESPVAINELDAEQVGLLEEMADDRDELLGEVRRLRSNYDVALGVVEKLMKNHGRTMPGYLQIAMNDVKAKIAGLR